MAPRGSVASLKRAASISLRRCSGAPPSVLWTAYARTSRRSVCVHRQRELKHGAVGHGCRGPQPAAMGLHDRAADRKSHTHAAGFGGEEGDEQPVHILGGDPDAAIRHTDERLAWLVLA